MKQSQDPLKNITRKTHYLSLYIINTTIPLRRTEYFLVSFSSGYQKNFDVSFYTPLEFTISNKRELSIEYTHYPWSQQTIHTQ